MTRADATPRAETKRPRLPPELYRPNFSCVAAFVLFSLVLCFGSSWLAMRLWLSDLPLWLRLAGVPPLVVLAAHGFQMLGFVGHEGLHLNLHRSKVASMLLGCAIGGIATSSVVGHGLGHWNHHRFTNSESDPDAAMYAPFRSFASRLFWPRFTSHSQFHRNTWLLATGAPLPFGYKLPFDARTQRLLARADLGILALWLAFWIALAILHPVYFLFALPLPALAGFPLTSWRVFAEHADTEHGMWRNSRSYSSRLFTVLFFGNNFHLEHHLYPGVPCYHLPRVHRILGEAGHLERERSFIDAGVLDPLVLTRARHRYPEPRGEDSDDDPFVASTPAATAA